MGDTALVTGCSTGIGRATAEAFVARGWTVYATARDRRDVRDLERRGCRTDALDVTDADAVERVVGRVLDEQGRVDCLVNNAGVVEVSTVGETSTADLRALFEVNLFGPHRLIRAVVPSIRARRTGTVVNVGSVAGWFPVPGEGGYSASKFALRALTASLRDELRPFGVRVVLVEPPFVRTRHVAIETAATRGRERSPYLPLYERFERYARAESASALAPERVARTVVRVAAHDSPRARYPVGPTARFQILLSLLPSGLRYRLWRWAGRR